MTVRISEHIRLEAERKVVSLESRMQSAIDGLAKQLAGLLRSKGRDHSLRQSILRLSKTVEVICREMCWEALENWREHLLSSLLNGEFWSCGVARKPSQGVLRTFLVGGAK
eukprot:scaffold6342_cov206-Alexandrium_tamarense.AAC.59